MTLALAVVDEALGRIHIFWLSGSQESQKLIHSEDEVFVQASWQLLYTTLLILMWTLPLSLSRLPFFLPSDCKSVTRGIIDWCFLLLYVEIVWLKGYLS